MPDERTTYAYIPVTVMRICYHVTEVAWRDR
jgi:hypothetical protein